MDACPSTPQLAPAAAVKPPRKPNGQGPPRKSRAFKARLLSCEELDGRTHARKHFLAVAKGVSEDLGGVDFLSTVQKTLVESFAGIAVLVADTNTRLMRGDKIDVLAHAQTVSTLVRVATRIGLHRVPRELSTLSEYLREPAPAEEHAPLDGGAG
jgi:hypothetical protein